MSIVSVVIPTYKASAFIRDTLASVFAQTRLPDEVIVADDCSPDDTAAVVEEIARTAPVPVQVIRLEKNSGGPAKPLNVGIEAARGDLIATLDHDDTFTPNKLADQTALFERNPHVGLIFGDVQTDGPDRDWCERIAYWLYELTGDFKHQTLPGGGYLIPSAVAVESLVRHLTFLGTCSNMLFPKAVWRSIDGFDEGCRVACDLAFLARVVSRYDLSYLPTPSAIWLLHPDSFYRTSARGLQVYDRLRAFEWLARQPLQAPQRHQVRNAVREFATDEAYALRQEGRYWEAARRLGSAIQTTGPWTAGITALVKLVPHRAIRLVRGYL